MSRGSKHLLLRRDFASAALASLPGACQSCGGKWDTHPGGPLCWPGFRGGRPGNNITVYFYYKITIMISSQFFLTLTWDSFASLKESLNETGSLGQRAFNLNTYFYFIYIFRGQETEDCSHMDWYVSKKPAHVLVFALSAGVCPSASGLWDVDVPRFLVTASLQSWWNLSLDPGPSLFFMPPLHHYLALMIKKSLVLLSAFSVWEMACQVSDWWVLVELVSALLTQILFLLPPEGECT